MFEGSIKRPYKAVNTFSRRPCLNQILSYLLLALDNFSFWLTVQNHYASETARYAIIALFLLSLLALLVLGGLTSSSDPADPIMAHHRNGLTYDAGNDQLCLYCQHCESYVLMTSKHCKLCDRCVEQFDHHCVWINNCIGKCNYKVFIGMILTAWVHLIVYVVGVCVLWAQGGWGHFLPEMVLNWVVMGIVVLFSLMLLALIILHFVLIAKNTTTFQFMMARKAAQINPAPNEIVHTSSNQIHLKNKDSVVSERGDEGNQVGHRSTLHETPFKDINKEVSNQEQEQSQHFKESRLSIMKNSNIIKAKSEMDKRTDLQLQSGTDILKSSKALKLLIGGSLKIKQMRRNVSCKALKKEKQAEISNKSQEKYSEYQMKANQKFENINVIFQQ